MHVDPARATLSNLVHDVLKPELGYGTEISIRNDAGLLYDPDFDDNLPKKFKELGITNDSMLTIVDEDDGDPHVDLSLAVVEKAAPDGEKPVVLQRKIEVGRKGQSFTNGNGISGEDSHAKRKRSASPVPEVSEKKGKMDSQAATTTSTEAGDGALLVNDQHGGAIVID